MNRTTAALAIAAYLATIVAANYAVQHVGIVTVAPGLVAPAGVYFAGLALTFRDLVQTLSGRAAVVAAILVGAALSWWIAPALAVASATAFLVSELADFAVYTPLEHRHPLAAVAVSNTVGAIIDSALFLWIAFGSLDFFKGQVVGKLEMTALAVAVLAIARAWARSSRELAA